MVQTSVTPHGHAKLIGGLMIVLGLAVILFWICGMLLQIQTSEAFLLGKASISTFSPDWAILLQPIDLVKGQLSNDMSKAVIWGWGIELAYLIFVIGYEAAHLAIGHSSTRLVVWFRTALVLLVAFDFWTDFQYGSLPSGLLGQVAFAAITAFVVAFFGLIGLYLIEKGVQALK